MKILSDRSIYKTVDEFAAHIYNAASKFPHDDQYGLSSQVRRTAVAMTTSVVDSYTAVKSEDILIALERAYSSLRSLHYQIGLAQRLGYIDERRFSVCDRKAAEADEALTIQIGSLGNSVRPPGYRHPLSSEAIGTGNTVSG